MDSAYWLIKRILKWWSALFEDPEYHRRPIVALPSSGYRRLDYLRAHLVETNQTITLTSEVVDALFLLDAPNAGPVADYALRWYWASLTRAAARLTADQWAILSGEANHFVVEAVTADEIRTQFDKHYDGDQWQEHVLQFRDRVLPQLLSLSQAEFDGVRETCRLLRNVDATGPESLSLFALKIPSLVD